MKIALIINARTPYRQKQITKLSELEEINKLDIFYTHSELILRKWKVEPYNKYKITEYILTPLIKTRFGNLNKGLLKVVKEYDLIVLTGYEQPSYILAASLCRLYKKPYVIIIDGMNPQKCIINKRDLLFTLKSYLLNGASAIFGNGTVTLKYLQNFNCTDKLFNQYLTVDIDSIRRKLPLKDKIRHRVREKYKFKNDDFIILYSGRVIERKNIQAILKSISRLNMKKVKLLIAGGGEYQNQIIDLATQLGVEMTITGFIEEQQELFDYYFAADLLMLPSFNEVWGLVINEALAAGLPVIASNEVGSSYDLIKDGLNGFVINPNNIHEISDKISVLINNKELCEKMGRRSLELISEWNFESSKESFSNLLKYINL